MACSSGEAGKDRSTGEQMRGIRFQAGGCCLILTCLIHALIAMLQLDIDKGQGEGEKAWLQPMELLVAEPILVL